MPMGEQRMEEGSRGSNGDMAEEAHGIVIAGGGICGLATALALHRKGIASLVLEKSRSLRAEGAGIGVHANGWRVLEQLGVAAELRDTAHLLTSYHEAWQQGNKITREDQYPARTELRCLSRKDLIEALAKDLPAGAIRFGCQIAAIHEDPGSHGAILTMVDGTTIKAKVLIGCDGTNSVVGRYLGLPPLRTIPRLVLRGFTAYPHGSPFKNDFLRLRVGELFIGRSPINDNLVHFFVTMPNPSKEVTMDPKKVRGVMLERLQDLECATDIIEMVRQSDPESLHFVTKLWYRPPWEVALGRFQKGTVTVAGDAMHAMGPYIGQGGSSGLEDAIVLARSLARAVDAGSAGKDGGPELCQEMIVEAIGEYIRERRLRVTRLSFESFIVGLMARSPSPVTKLACVVVLILLGRKSSRHANYDCGRI